MFDVEKQKEFLNSYKDQIFSRRCEDYERSYFQYKCQQEIGWASISKIDRLGSLFLLILLVFVLLLLSFFRYTHYGSKSVFYGKNTDLLPLGLAKVTKVADYKFSLGCLFGSDRQVFIVILNSILVSKFDAYFVLKVLYRVLIYSHGLKNENIKCILSTSEYSFSSSIATRYCELNSVKHINVMHGEKVFFIRDAFCRYSSVILWDSFYLELFRSLKQKFCSYYIFNPFSGRIDSYRGQGSSVICYYLQNETNDELREIQSILSVMANKYKVKVRPHPVYSSHKDVIRIFGESNVDIEKTIEGSLSSVEFACSKYSTALYIARSNGVKTLIDDISNPRTFNELLKQGFRSYQWDENNVRLSEFISKYTRGKLKATPLKTETQS